MRTTGSQFRRIPQPEGAQLAALAAPTLPPLLLATPKDEIALFTVALQHAGQQMSFARRADRTSFSNRCPHSAHTYSKIGISVLLSALDHASAGAASSSSRINRDRR